MFMGKINIFKILEYIVAILLILTANTVYVSALPQLHINMLLMLSVIVLAILSLILLYRRHVDVKPLLIVTLGYTLYLAIFILFSPFRKEKLILFLLYFFILFISFMIYFTLKKADNSMFQILFYLSDIFTLLCVISLFCWLLFCVFGIFDGSAVYLPWAHQYISNYHWVHFSYQTMTPFGISIVRNTGIFSEAPMFSYVLIVALLSEMFLRKNIITKRTGIFSVTILTTGSTTGIIMMTIAFLVVYIQRQHKNGFIEFFRIVLVPLVLLIAGYIGYTLLNSKMQTTSFSVRWDDFNAGYLAWKNHIWFGNGYNNINALQQNMALWRVREGGAALGYSSGIFNILSDGGVFFILLYLFPIFLYLFKRVKDEETLWLYMFILIMLLITVVPYLPLTLLIISLVYIRFVYE